jgi:hypothetical protein
MTLEKRFLNAVYIIFYKYVDVSEAPTHSTITRLLL